MEIKIAKEIEALFRHKVGIRQMEEFVEKGSRGACYMLERGGFDRLYTSTCIGSGAYNNFEYAGYMFWIAVFATMAVLAFVAMKLFQWTFE